MALFTISLLVNVGVLTWVVIDSQYTGTRICQGQNEVRAAIREQIRQGGEALLKTDYYRTHPKELKRARQDNKDALARFANIPCKDAPFHKTPV